PRLHTSSGDRDHTVLHVGISHLPERHFGAAPEVHIRSKLRASDAGAVCVFFCLLLIFSAVVEGREQDRLSEDHGSRLSHHVAWSVLVLAATIRSFVSPVLNSAGGSRCRDYGPAGIR